MTNTNKTRRLARNWWKIKLFMLHQLPMGFIAGLKITEIDSEKSVVTVPFNFINKNPFNSMYFAVQAMAAELSSGILALSEVNEASKPVSMLVINMKASYIKKAKSKVKFVCADGQKIRDAIIKSIETGEGRIIEVNSKGTDMHGDVVAEFVFTWTFKPK
jgi:acyl-coenzyme A thioesterase PaaI-like protein